MQASIDGALEEAVSLWARAQATPEAEFAEMWLEANEQARKALAKAGDTSLNAYAQVTVTVQPATCEFAKWLRRNEIGWKHYQGGWTVAFYSGELFACQLFAFAMSTVLIAGCPTVTTQVRLA